MKTYIIWIFCLISLLNSCNGQNKDNSDKKIVKNKIVEKFDQNIYKKTNYGFNSYIIENGTIISMMDYDSLKGGVQREILSKPSFLTIYKEFYANGNIKKKQTFVGERTKINISEYYDEDGNLETVDENKKFGKIQPEDVLKFLEKKKIINLKTGEGRFDGDERPTFEISFENDNDKKYFIISIKNGKTNDNPDFSGGEPRASIDLDYKMDGETGKVGEIK